MAKAMWKDEKYFFFGLFLVLIIASFALYASILPAGFLSDDWGYAYLAKVAPASSALTYLWSVDHFGNGGGNFRPLISVITVLIWKPFLANPWVLHAISVILHAIASWLVGFLSYKLFKNRAASAISSLIFLFFPLNVEVAVWLSNWNTLFSAIFLLTALVLYCDYHESRDKKKTLLIVLFMGLLSLSAKEFALLLPFFVVAIDLFLKRKISWMLVGLFIVLNIVYFAWRFAVLGKIGGYGEMNALPQNLQAVFAYLALPKMYLHRYFNAEAVPQIISQIAYIFPFLIGALTIFFWRNKSLPIIFGHVRNISLFILCIYVSSVLGWNLIHLSDIHAPHGRLFYISSAWFAILIGYLFIITPKPFFYGVIGAYIMLCATLSIYQIQPWIRAGDISGRITQTIKDSKLPSDSAPSVFDFERLPDNNHGAFIFRNGIDYATALMRNQTINDIIVIKTMQDQPRFPIIVNHQPVAY